MLPIVLFQGMSRTFLNGIDEEKKLKNTYIKKKDSNMREENLEGRRETMLQPSGKNYITLYK